MSNVEYQLSILEAMRTQRAMQVRRRQSGESPVPNPWIALKHGDQLLNFIKYQYRIAPVTEACWLVFDLESKQYVGEPWTSASKCATACMRLNETAGRAVYTPIPMEPA